MYTEIKEATYLLTSYLVKQVPRQKVAWFAEAFANNLMSRVVNYMLDSNKKNFVSPVVIQSTVEVALGGGELLAYLPNELSIYVAVGEVKARVNGVVSVVWKDLSSASYSPIPWPVLHQSLSERTVMVLSYDQKIRTDFIPLELVAPDRVGHNNPLVTSEAATSDLPQVKMFRAAGPARFVFTAKNFACTRFGNRRRRTRAMVADQKPDFSVRRASQEVVPCEEKSHFFHNNWWNNFFNSSYFMEALTSQFEVRSLRCPSTLA